MNRRQFLKSIGYLAGVIVLPFNMLPIKKPLPPIAYGDIPPRTAEWAAKKLLERGQPLMVIDRFGQRQDWKHAPATVKFRRYQSLH